MYIILQIIPWELYSVKLCIQFQADLQCFVNFQKNLMIQMTKGGKGSKKRRKMKGLPGLGGMPMNGMGPAGGMGGPDGMPPFK